MLLFFTSSHVHNNRIEPSRLRLVWCTALSLYVFALERHPWILIQELKYHF
jgi:hypothetical protein